MATRVSLIIPNRNRCDALKTTLNALAKQTAASYAFETVVVDDGSIDGSADVVMTYVSNMPVRVLRQENQGAGPARNRGARDASGELLVFLDADMIPSPGLLEAYLTAFASTPEAILIGRILAWPEAFQTSFDQVTGVELAHDLGPEPRELTFYNLASGNFAIGVETFRRLGGFDEALRMTEDTELGYRAAKAGIPLRYCPEAVGYHNHPKTLAQRCVYVRSSAYWTAHLLARHPQMAPLLPIYQDILPVAWPHDSAALIARKMGRRVFALRPARRAMESLIGALEVRHTQPRLLRSLYYKLMSGYRVEGFRAGWKEAAVHGRRMPT